jgi:hypothetical protein
LPQLLLGQATFDLALAGPLDRFLLEVEAVQAKHDQHRVQLARKVSGNAGIA